MEFSLFKMIVGSQYLISCTSSKLLQSLGKVQETCLFSECAIVKVAIKARQYTWFQKSCYQALDRATIPAGLHLLRTKVDEHKHNIAQNIHTPNMTACLRSWHVVFCSSKVPWYLTYTMIAKLTAETDVDLPVCSSRSSDCNDCSLIPCVAACLCVFVHWSAIYNISSHSVACQSPH